MDQALVAGLIGLAGAVIGGTASFATSWVTQQTQLSSNRRDERRRECETLFSDFIVEASRLYGDALSHQKDDVTALVGLYALLGRMRLVTRSEVVQAAEGVLQVIGETYIAPNRTLHELQQLASEGGMNVLADFGECCRRELDRIANSTR
jgi:hypothetical protein